MRNYLIEDLPHCFEEYKESIKNPKNIHIKK
jgi:acetyl-CoA synthetase